MGVKLFLVLLGAVGICSGFLHSEGKKYDEFLPEFKDEIVTSGFNLKVPQESIDHLEDKLRKQLEPEDVLKTRLPFDDDDEDEFENVDLTTPTEKMEDDEDIEAGTKLTVDYGKCGFVYGRIFYVSKNGTKGFAKLHESFGEGGPIDTSVEGSWKTQVTSESSGNLESKANISVSHNGKTWKSQVTAKSQVTSNSKERVVKKDITRFIGSSTSKVSSTIQVGNQTIPYTVTVSGGSETLPIPFGIFVTLFESQWNTTASGKSSSMTIRGDVTSRVVFSRKGHSLTKSKVRGYIISHQDSTCSATVLSVKSHIWTSLNKATGEVSICTHSKGRVYSRSQVGDMKVFSGSAVVAFEKDVVKPQKSGEMDHKLVMKDFIHKLVTRGMFKPSEQIFQIFQN